MKQIILLQLLLWASTCLFANNYLRVQHPQEWDVCRGKINEAEVHITPHGLYVEYEVFLTISAEDNFFEPNDSVEIQYLFELPKGSIVHDSWLWIDDSIIVADLIDRWTATQIYEGIVSRRQDPSILTQNNDSEYELNIYPLLGNGNRQLKMSFLIPSDISAAGIIADFPVSLFSGTNLYPDEVEVVMHSSSQFTNPTLIANQVRTTTSNDSVMVSYLNYEELIVSSVSVKYDTELSNGVLLSNYSSGTENYYQLGVLPYILLDSADTERNVLFVIDNEDNNYSNDPDSWYYYNNHMLEREQVFNYAKTFIRSSLDSIDNFNVVYFNDDVAFMDNSWISATDQNVMQKFNQIDTTSNSFGNTYSLISEAISFSIRNNKPTSIIFISNVDEYNQETDITQTINQLYDNFDSVPPIHCIDHSFLTNYYYWDYYYNSNEYLSELARRTGGNYCQVSYLSDIPEAIKRFSISNENPVVAELRIAPTLGLCYDNIQLQESDNIYAPILQTGKYIGEAPFEIELNVITEDHNFSSQSTTISPADSNSLLQKFWAGNKVLTMQDQRSIDNTQAKEIIKTSLQNRVLSRYTAFLALDPALNIEPEPCEDCVFDDYRWGIFPEFVTDGMWMTVGVDDEAPTDHEDGIKVYPNPLQKSSKLFINITDRENILSIDLIDVMGNKITSFDIHSTEIDIPYEDLNKGTYFIIAKTEQNVYSVKVLK